MPKVGYAVGTCSKCDKEISRLRPADYAVCDCHEYCPLCGRKMEPFTPDLSPGSYEKDDINVVRICAHHKPPYKSKLRPVEVRLS
jgi:predicted amidophosphoribosyltransferase